MGRFRSLAVLIAMVAAIAALAASGSEETAKKVDSSNEATSDTTAPAAESFKVGDLVELGDWQVKVHAFTDPVEIEADSMFAPEEGMRRVKVDAEVTNKGTEPETVSSLMCFSLKDNENKTYDQTLMADSSVGSIDGEVAPGSGLRGEVAYDVPQAATGFVLEFKCDLLSSGTASITLS